MQITRASITVENQEAALRFYTMILGFEKKADIPMGQFRWLTVSSPEGVAGAQLVLEAADFPPSRVYQKARFDAGIPAAAFITGDIDAEYRRLKARGVQFLSVDLTTRPARSNARMLPDSPAASALIGEHDGLPRELRAARAIPDLR